MSVYYRALLVVLLLPLFAPSSIASEEDQATSNFSGYVELNSGYNSNVFLQGNTESFVEPQTQSSEDDYQNQVILTGGYKFLDRVDRDMKIIVDYFYENFPENAIDSSSTDISLPLTYYTESMRFRVKPFYNQYRISGDNALEFTGTYMDITRKLGRYRLGLNYTYTSNQVIDEDYLSYEGTSNTMQLHGSALWLNHEYHLTLGYYANDYQAVSETYQAYYVNTLMHFKKQRFELSWFAQAKTKNYTVDPLDEFHRFDSQYVFSISPAYRIYKNVKLFAKSIYLKNISNDTDEMNYQQFQTLMGFRVVL